MNWKLIVVVLAGILLAAWLMVGVVRATEDLTKVIATGISSMYTPE